MIEPSEGEEEKRKRERTLSDRFFIASDEPPSKFNVQNCTRGTGIEQEDAPFSPQSGREMFRVRWRRFSMAVVDLATDLFAFCF